MARMITDTAGIGTHALAHEPGAAWAHAATCPDCRQLLTRDDDVRRQLALLRIGEPRIDVLEQVMGRIAQER
jgi:hypothetical protein